MRVRGIMGSFVRYVHCLLQFKISLGHHLLELRNFILLILSYLFSRYFVFVIFCVPQPPTGVGVTAQSVFGFSYPAVPYLGFLCSLIF